MRKALFLDRDGVINVEKNYLHNIENFEFIDGVFDTCRYFQKKGYLIIIVTNQAGIAKGIYNEEDYRVLTHWMLGRFLEEGVEVSAVYHCPHHPDFTGWCDCRKPAPGMFEQAKDEFNIDMASSISVGDKESDIEAGISAGVGKNYLITTGHKIENNRFNVEVLNNLKELIILIEGKNEGLQ
jgi:D-glycero-D-manno-heptose 1,7-bisphosphate phosphatase